MSVATPLGHDSDVFYNNLLKGVSGISEIEAFNGTKFPTRIRGEIFLNGQMSSTKKALAEAGITEEVMETLDKAKCGVLIGSAMGGIKIFNDAIEALQVSYKKMNPFCVPFATPNMGSAMLAMDLLRVNSTKSMIGHLLGASGAVEAVTAVQAIRTGWIHPNINLESPDEGVDTKLLVGPKKERLDVKVALSNPFRFGGHNSSVLFAPYK
ncbi:hypothetical protein ACFX2C_026698 [Malus domestica]